jgi:hypothetical protein
MAKQQSDGETTTATTQQGSVGPPPNNNGGDTTPAGGDDNSANNQSTPPSNSVGSVGLIADPVKDAGDNADTSKSGNTLIHCSPVTGCSQEDLGASNDDGKNSSSNANDDSDTPNDGDKSNSSTSGSEEHPILIMLANSSGGSRLGHQPGERRASGFGFGYSHQPLSHPQKAQRGGTQEMVQMGLG